jgi:nucleotide-binding universal stress UspA family protein
MLERILVAVDDDSGASLAAIEAGIALGETEGARVIFVHVASILGDELDSNGTRPHRVPERAQVPALREALRRAEEAGVQAEAELLIGYAVNQIAALAEEIDADLVIVGSRHLTGAKRMLRGSTSRALLDATRRPILIVTEPAPDPALA